MVRRPSDRRRTSELHQTRARQLRRSQTRVEMVLWEQLRDRRLGGMKFRRQHPIGRFIVDFCCVEHRLVIEVDGLVHEEVEQTLYDQERTAVLEAAGYRLIRITNDQVTTDLPDVLQTVRAALGNR